MVKIAAVVVENNNWFRLC